MSAVYTTSKQKPKQMMQWKHKTSPARKEAKVVASAGKVMASVFWDAKGILIIDYFRKDCTLSTESTAPTCWGSSKEKSNPSGLECCQKCFVSPGQCACTKVFGCNVCYSWLWVWIGWPSQYPSYSPDFAPSDYNLFPNMKKKNWVENGPSYQADHDVISAVDDYFEGQEETFFKTGIRMLKHCWKKCVDRKGDCANK